MALTREQRIAALKWLGGAFFVHQVIGRLERKFGVTVTEQEIRNLDPTFLANLPPDDFAIWRTERDKVENGDVPCASANYRLALRSNAVQEFADNNQFGHALNVLNQIDALTPGNKAGNSAPVEAFEWTIQEFPEKSDEQAED